MGSIYKVFERDQRKSNKKIILLVTIIMTLLFISSFLSGCTQLKQSFTYDGRTRHYVLHLPLSYNPGKKTPLVIVLHGGGGNADNIQETTEMNTKADKEGFIVVYPEGTGLLPNRFLTWNSGYCCGYALKHNVDDVGFIRFLIDYLKQKLSIDNQRIYITGFSNGAIMAYRLGAELSDIIAAIAPVAGSIGGNATENTSYWEIPTPTTPVSVIAFHGKQDARIPFDGGKPTIENTKGAYLYASVNHSIAFWVTNNHCNPQSQINISANGNIITTTYSGGNNQTEVVLYTIVDGTHAWPGGKPGWFGGDEPTQDISATDLMWDFFVQHPKK